MSEPDIQDILQRVNVLYDERLTTALIGRLMHHVELILFPGGNNRLRESSINEMITRTTQQSRAHVGLGLATSQTN